MSSEKELPDFDSLADLEADDLVYADPDATRPELENNDDPDYDESNEDVDESQVGEPEMEPKP